MVQTYKPKAGYTKNPFLQRNGEIIVIKLSQQDVDPFLVYVRIFFDWYSG